MIIETKGSLFEDTHEALAHGVSNLGVMGVGIARKFKKIYPEMFDEYRNLCVHNALHPGDIFVYKPNIHASGKNITIYNLVTQDNLERADEQYLKRSINWMYLHARKNEISDIAIPRIGCGKGKMHYEQLLDALHNFAIDSSHHVTIYTI